MKLLYKYGREEHVGVRLWNENIHDELYLEFNKKDDSIKIHGYLKDTIKFDIRRVKVESRFLY